jgi:glutathione S-transferase
VVDNGDISVEQIVCPRRPHNAIYGIGRPRSGWYRYGAFSVMEKHLVTHDFFFFAADRYTIADIALYGYTHIANECDFDLTGFPAIRAWLKRIAEQPGHVGMDWHPAAMAIAV